MIRKMMIAGVGAMCAGLALAGPPDPEHIPADSTWVLHVDLEAARHSTLAPLLDLEGDVGLGDWEIPSDEIEQAAEEVRQAQADHGITLGEDVRAVTLFGEGGDPEQDGVLIIEMGAVADEIVREMRREAGEDIEVVHADGYELLKVDEGGGPAYGRLHPGSKPDQRFVVLGSSAENVTRALRAMDGRIESVADDPAALFGVGPRDGSILFLSAADLSSFPDFEATSEVARLANTLTIDIGESGDAVYANAVIATGSAEDAGMVRDVLQGLIALGRLIASEDPELQELDDMSQGLSVRTDGSSIVLDLSVPSQMIEELLGGLDPP